MEQQVRPSLVARFLAVILIVAGLVAVTGCSGFDDPTVEAADTSAANDDNGEGPRGSREGESSDSPDSEESTGESTDGENTDGSSADGESTDGSSADGENTDGENTDGGGGEEATDRLVIETADGHLFTIRPDGTDRVDLTDPAENTDNSQAAWSPDGSRLAWAQIDQTTGEARVRTDRYDASSPLDTEVQSPPFYLSWSPTSSSVAYLNNSVGGFDLGLASVNPEEPAKEAQLLDRGAPYFFSWGPDDDELLVHASEFRLDRIDLDGQTRIIDENLSSFGAPIWASEVDSLIYGRTEGDMGEVVATGTLGEGGQTLVRYDGSVRMAVSPAMNRIALIAYPLTANGEQGDGSIVTASAPVTELGMRWVQTDPDEPDDPADPFEPTDEPSVLVTGELTQVGIYGGDAWSLPTTDVVAFYWDPTGTVLAWLEPTSEGRLQWWYTDDTGIWPGPEFTPSSVFYTEYLPFFDQYGQSHTFFSPSGESLAFAGTLTDGQEGVFVVSLDPGSNPTKIADGVMAQWSPTSAGGGAQSPL